MSTYHIDDVERLQRINEALVNRVERAMDQQQNAFSLFQTAISLDGQVRRRTDELTATIIGVTPSTCTGGSSDFGFDLTGEKK